MKRLTPIFAIAACLLLQGSDYEHDVNQCYQYPMMPELYDGPTFHTVCTGESLIRISNGYFDYLSPMVKEETGMPKPIFMQAIVEQIGRLNDILPHQYHKIQTDQIIEIPYLTPSNCASLIVSQDWQTIDELARPPIRPRQRPN